MPTGFLKQKMGLEFGGVKTGHDVDGGSLALLIFLSLEITWNCLTWWCIFVVLTVLTCSRYRGVGSRVDCFVLGIRPFASESCRKKEITIMLREGLRWVLGVAD